ncbi:hypothetical protein CYMTET_36290, partial [Cymbomonas tetramitiformis]
DCTEEPTEQPEQPEDQPEEVVAETSANPSPNLVSPIVTSPIGTQLDSRFSISSTPTVQSESPADTPENVASADLQAQIAACLVNYNKQPTSSRALATHWAFFWKLRTLPTPGKSSNTVISQCIVCQPTLLKDDDEIPLAKNKKFEQGFCAYDIVAGPGALQTHVQRSHSVLAGLVKKKLEARREGNADNASASVPKGGKGKKRSGTEIDLYYKDVKKFKKDNPRQLQLLDDLCLCVGKGLMPISIVESPWLRRLVYNQDPRVVFPNRGAFRTEHLHKFSENIFLEHTLPRLKTVETVSLTFDLWMSHKTEEIFSVVTLLPSGYQSISALACSKWTRQ